MKIRKLATGGDARLYSVFFLVWVGFSYPFFLQRKAPAPLDFLVNFYAPWDAYYDSPIKNSALSDVVSQIIPWKIFNAEELKAGRLPFWNPYNLAGAPHLGNWQSGVLYPTTLLFLAFPVQIAWSLHVLLQPLLAGMFMILFLRSLSLSRFSSLFGAVAFAYGGFMTTWLEWGTLGHALLWLPLALFSIEKSAGSQKPEARSQKFNWLLILALTMSLFAGHPQTTIYVVIISSAYWLYHSRADLHPPLPRRRTRRYHGHQAMELHKIKLLITVLLSCYLVPLFLAAPQVFPAVSVYLNSSRTLVDGTSWAKAFLIPPSGLLTFLAPDFFGNPATRNSWSNFSYVEMNGYAGIVVLMLVFSEVYETSRWKFRKLPTSLFFFGVVFIGLALSANSPVSRWLIDLNIPIISTSSPARLMGVIGFALAVLGASGFNRLGKLSLKRRVGNWPNSLITIAIILGAMWLWTFISTDPNVLISRRNLILPSLIALSAAGMAGLYFFPGKKNRRLLSRLFLFGFLLLSIADLFRFHHKFIPYADSSMWYPRLPVLSELKNRQERSFGLLDGNLNLPFRIYSLDGYDPMMSAEYARLTYPAEELAKRNRVTGPYFPKGQSGTINLASRLGGKWFVDAAVPGGAPWDLRLWEYGDQFARVWEDDKYQILFNTKADQTLIEPIGGVEQSQRRLFAGGLLTSLLTILWICFSERRFNQC